ncbi:MAG: OmpP1/FadL family transporter [Vicingaceae bacterium]
MKKLVLLMISSIFVLSDSFAQNEFDVLRYSTVEHYGDARFSAMGGSFGALGANLSALSTNPGGLGVYKSSDFSFTPSFHYNYSESNKDGNNVTDGKLNFHFSNVGIAGNFAGDGDWKAVNIAIGYNRLNNYNTSIAIKSSTNNSYLNTYANELNANGGTFEDDIPGEFPFSSNLAYQTYLVNPIFTDSLKYDHVFKDSKNISQLTNYETRGGAGEMYFAVGTNYSDKLYLGASLGIPTVRYVYDRNYTETSDPSDTLTAFKSFTVHDYVRTSGAGVNLKLGAIYKVADWFRIGTAFHTPTVYSLSDQWSTTVSSENKTGEVLTETSPSGNFEYMITTPYRFISSAAFIVGRYGVVNADYEIVDYATARINEDAEFGTADFSVENQSIRNNFRSTHNIRVGTEWRLDPFRLRAGYRYQGDPLKNNFNIDNSASIYSVGFGVKQEEYYFDMAYSQKQHKAESAIDANQNDFASVSLTDHYISFTLGFRF